MPPAAVELIAVEGFQSERNLINPAREITSNRYAIFQSSIHMAIVIAASLFYFVDSLCIIVIGHPYLCT